MSLKKKPSYRLNDTAKLNGFKSSTEMGDLLNMYTQELSKIMNDKPNEFLHLIMKAKKLKQEQDYEAEAKAEALSPLGD